MNTYSIVIGETQILLEASKMINLDESYRLRLRFERFSDEGDFLGSSEVHGPVDRVSIINALAEVILVDLNREAAVSCG